MQTQEGLLPRLERWEKALNHQAGFQSQRRVYAAYEIVEYPDDGVFLEGLSGKETKVYAPLTPAYRKLPCDFANLTQGDDTELLAFALQYGLLGYQQMVPPAGGDSEADVFRRLNEAEPLDWLWTHVETVKLCLTLISLVQSGGVPRIQALLQPWQRQIDEATLRGELEWLVPAPERFNGFMWLQIPRVGLMSTIHEPFDYILMYQPTWIDTATDLCCSIISSNITDVRRIVGTDDTGEITSFFASPTLLGHIYWRLADELTQGKVRRCAAQDCQAFFIQHRRGQQYCPHPEGGESRCANRQRIRRYRGNIE